jgi:hypothetical protein
MTDRAPFEPTAAIEPAMRAGDDEPPPPPPHGLAHDAVERQFTVGDRTWIARLSGRGAVGTGSYGLGLVDAVHFFSADRPDEPLYEALLARGRLAVLFDAELERLLSGATPITT